MKQKLKNLWNKLKTLALKIASDIKKKGLKKWLKDVGLLTRSGLVCLLLAFAIVTAPAFYTMIFINFSAGFWLFIGIISPLLPGWFLIFPLAIIFLLVWKGIKKYFKR